MDIKMGLLCWMFFLCTLFVFLTVCMLLNFYDMGRYYWKFGKQISVASVVCSLPFLFYDTAVWFALIFITCACCLLTINYRRAVSAARESGQATTITLRPKHYRIIKRTWRSISEKNSVWERFPDCNTIFTDGSDVVYMMQHALEDTTAEWELLCRHIRDDGGVSYWMCLEPLHVTRQTSYLRVIGRTLCFLLSVAFLATASLQEGIRASQIDIDASVMVRNSNLMLSILGVLLVIGCIRLAVSKLVQKTMEKGRA